MFSKFFDRADLPLSEGESQARQKKLRRILFVAGLILVLGAAGYFSARPAFSAVRGWQARRHAGKAFGFIDQQKWGEARAEAVAAYQLRSTEPQALRAVARLLSRAGQPDALGFWKELRLHQDLTRDDLRDEAAVALKGHELDIAADAIKHLAGEPGGLAPSDLLLAAQLAIQRQDLDGATVPIRQINNSPNATDREKFQATLLLATALRNKNATDQTEVFGHLVKLARGSNDVSLDALVALGQTFLQSKNPWPNPDGMSVDDLIRALDSHPLAKPQHKLLGVDLAIHQHPEDRDNIVQNTVARFKGGDNGTLIALAAWLNSHGEYQRELDTVPRQRAMQSRELFFQHVDALGALGQWDEIRKLIESEQFPLDPVVEHMYLARCFAQQNQANGAENNWRRALEAAAGDTQKLMTLGDYAEKNGALDVAGAAYQAAVAVSPKLRAAQQGRLRIAYATRDTKKIHEILKELLKIWPNDDAVQNDEAYARLLLMPNVSVQPSVAPELRQIESLAETLVNHEPASLPHRTLLALARLKQNRPYAAMEVYRGINVPKNSMTTSSVAVHAAVMAATAEKEAAAKEFAALPEDKLLPEERALKEGYK